ncbi:hypothetical protein [Hyphomicrobium sp.]|uniref:hypothetical protein n=1 Tax=Hyphomicrobium sp. TaxID=82 RepID=UPI002E30B929|nr:hypothetical protein [Hyphomicrobium sp.]HEX2842898.1 hypothetical protein [Hyphomicrobium sp.]
MTLNKPAGQQAAATFGRRGVKTTPAKGPATQRKPTISPRPEQRAQDAIQEAAQSAGEQVAVQASRGKAYFKACLAGTAAFIAALFALTGVDNKLFQAGPMLIFLAIPVLPTLALILYIPTVVLSDIARLLSIPRGWADLGIGLTLGMGLGIATAMSSGPDTGKSMMMGLAMTAGGFIGGFAFWRAQGYPGTSSGSAAAFDQAYDHLT